MASKKATDTTAKKRTRKTTSTVYRFGDGDKFRLVDAKTSKAAVAYVIGDTKATKATPADIYAAGKLGIEIENATAQATLDGITSP